jgi:hypothetical protein
VGTEPGTGSAGIAALAAAVLAHGAGLSLIYLTAFTAGAGAALRDTAAVTCVPRLVQPADLDRANGRVIAGQIVGNELAIPVPSIRRRPGPVTRPGPCRCCGC